MKTYRFVNAGALLVTLGALFTAPAATVHAQESADDAPLDMIVVTARKRGEESILDVPLSVTALSADYIENAGFENILDVAQATPGFFFESFNSLPGRYDSVPYIRGVVFDTSNATQQTVSVFVDGVFVSGGTQTIGVEDVERIEVIKGPQSATFGRTTFAGAINYVTADPGDEFRLKLSGTAASRNEYEANFLLDGPIVADVVSGRLSGRFADKEGHFDNQLVPGQTLGDEETWSIGGTLLFTPSDNFRTKVRYFYSEMDDGHPAVTLIDSTFNNFGPLPNVIPDPDEPDGFADGEAIFQGTLPIPAFDQIGLNTSAADFQNFVDAAAEDEIQFLGGSLGLDRFGLAREASRFSIQSSYDIDSLGITIDGLFGYNTEDVITLLDTDTTADNTFLLFGARDFEDTNFELRVSGSAMDERLTLSGGVSLYNLELLTNGEFFTPAFFNTFFGNGAPTETKIDTRGVFVQLGYNVTERFNISLEARYQVDEIDEIDATGSSVEGSPEEFRNFLPRLTAYYQPADDTLLYASYSKGNRPGGFNSNFFEITEAQRAELAEDFPSVSGTFDEEELNSFEIGWKQSLLDNRLSFALAGFYMDRQDQTAIVVAQLTGDPTLGEPAVITDNFTVNAATSDIYGSEIEAFWTPTDNWSFRGSLAYVKAEIDSFPDGGDAGDFTDVFGPAADFSGIEAERYPTWQGAFSGTYEKETSNAFANLFGANPSWYVRADLFLASEYFLENTNLGEAPSVTDLRLRTGIRSDNMMIELFATNVLDEDAPVAANNYIDLSSATPLFAFTVEATQFAFRDRRQVGIRLSYEF